MRSQAGGGDATDTPTAAALGQAERKAYLLDLRKRRRFGNYTRREVMHIKLLFARLDKDQSGTCVADEWGGVPRWCTC